MRLQMRGYIIRWATYSKGGFKEGVSLTVDDELNRWQKYAYGECLTLSFTAVLIDESAGCNEFVDLLIHLASHADCNKVDVQSVSAMVASGTDCIRNSQIFVVQGTISLQDIHACL
jgi:Glycosyl transferase family group 2